MTTTIRDIDGLPSGEISLMVANSERKTVALLDERFKEHRELMERRLDGQDEKLDGVQKCLSALVGSGPLPGLVVQIKETLDRNNAVQSAWHEDSVAYRITADNSRVEILDRLGQVEGQMRLIRWMVIASKGFARGATGCFGLLKKSKMWEVFGIGVLLLSIEHFSPKLFHFLLQALHTR